MNVTMVASICIVSMLTVVHTNMVMVTNTVPGILVTKITKVDVPVVTFATKVTSVGWLL